MFYILIFNFKTSKIMKIILKLSKAIELPTRSLAKTEVEKFPMYSHDLINKYRAETVEITVENDSILKTLFDKLDYELVYNVETEQLKDILFVKIHDCTNRNDEWLSQRLDVDSEKLLEFLKSHTPERRVLPFPIIFGEPISTI